MAFMVSEVYDVDPHNLEALKRVLKGSLYLFEQIDAIEHVEILEDREDFKVIANSTWKSKQSFNEYLKSEVMLKLLQSEEMAKIKQIATSFEMKTYNVL